MSRLIYGYAHGVKRGPRRAALAMAAAREIDQGLGRSGLARPLLLVSGFWRSGTTWLQESLSLALGAKTVFEPLSPMEPLRTAQLAAQFPGDDEDLRQATIPGPWRDDDPAWRYLDRTCTGQLATEYLMSCRRDVAESFRLRIVVKDVRLQANLRNFHRRYATPVIHLRRHPCAVVASLISADWHWSFARAPLAVLLPRFGPALSVAEHAAVLRFDTDVLQRIAAFWAVTERLAARELAGQPWGTVVSYERFSTDPRMVLSGLCRRFQLAERGTVDFSTPSATVHPEAFAAYGAAPRERWRKLLSSDDIAEVERVADALYPDWRNDAGSATS